jgi:hypothetical protein
MVDYMTRSQERSRNTCVVFLSCALRDTFVNEPSLCDTFVNEPSLINVTNRNLHGSRDPHTVWPTKLWYPSRGTSTVSRYQGQNRSLPPKIHWWWRLLVHFFPLTTPKVPHLVDDWYLNKFIHYDSKNSYIMKLSSFTWLWNESKTTGILDAAKSA